MKSFEAEEIVKIDTAHSELILGLVKANKPRSVLEIGLGGGKSTDAILEALEFNQQSYDYTLVDNWIDWQGQMPEGVKEKYSKLKIITSDEKAYIASCRDKFDFIMSDGDHHNTEKWFDHVYSDLLNDNGILVYHDVNFIDSNAFHNLKQIYLKAKDRRLSHQLFNLSSRQDERCERGLLVIFKNESINYL